MVNAPLRIGLYEPIRNLVVGDLPPGENPSIKQKIISGLLAGAIGITVANPTDVVKIRMQSQAKGGEIKYTSAIDCYKKSYKAGGLPEFWTGYGPNLLRNSVISCAEVASYDQYKQMILTYTPLGDTLITHILCGLLAGFTATVVGSPFDVVKTRMMSNKEEYRNPVEAVVKTFRNDGPLAFYNGFFTNFARIGTWNTIMFVTFENLKKRFAYPQE